MDMPSIQTVDIDSGSEHEVSVMDVVESIRESTVNIPVDDAERGQVWLWVRINSSWGPGYQNTMVVTKTTTKPKGQGSCVNVGVLRLVLNGHKVHHRSYKNRCFIGLEENAISVIAKDVTATVSSESPRMGPVTVKV